MHKPFLKHLIALALLACTWLPAQASRLALVIGNAAYKDGPLKNPVNDARAMADKLGRLGFAVTKVENLRRDDISRTVRQFTNRIKAGDDVVVFYAGHGVQVKGSNYLPAVDARIEDEADVPLNSLNLGDLLDRLDEAKAGVKLVLLDACRNNPYARSFRSADRGLARITNAPSGTLIQYATRPGRVAADGTGANGMYTSQLLKNLDTPGLQVEALFKRVASDVKKASNGEQEPWVEGNLDGEFTFNPAASVQVATLRPEPINANPLPTRGREEHAASVTIGESVASIPTFAEARNSDPVPIEEIDFRRGIDGVGRVIVTLPNNRVGVDVRQQGQTLVVDFLRSTLPKGLRRQLDVSDFGTPVETVSTDQADGFVRMLIKAHGQWEHSTHQSKDDFVIEVKEVKPDPNKTRPMPVYQGQKPVP